MHRPVPLLAALLAVATGCRAEPLELDAVASDGGVEVTATRPLDRVEIFGDRRELLVVRRVDPPTDRVGVALALPPGARGRVLGRAGGIGSVAPWSNPPAEGAIRLGLEVPWGHPARTVRGGERVEVPLPPGSRAPFALHLDALVPLEIRVSAGDVAEAGGWLVPGERRTVVGSVAEAGGPLPVEVSAGGAAPWTFDLVPRPLSPEAVADRLRIVGVRFPADAWGNPEQARRPDRVDLPSPWWHALLARAGLGIRARPDQAPWAWQAVTLENRGTTDLPVVLGAAVLDAAGEPARAFRPRLREADGGTGRVTALLTVPAGARATAALPLFVDDAALSAEATTWTRRIEILPLGGDTPLVVRNLPLHARRGNTWATLGLVLALGSGAAGLLLLGARLGRWLRAARTSDLVTLALFGTLTFVVSVASQLLGMAIGAVLGPFSPLLTGLVDDVFRVALLATLVTLLPRPGTVALAVLQAFLLRGLAMGSFHPLDLVSLGTSVAWMEGSLFLVGATRTPGWHDRPRGVRRVGLTAAFALAGMVSTLGNLAMSAVFYRLWYTGWYVAALLALPSGVYMAVACWLAVPFADSLRRVRA